MERMVMAQQPTNAVSASASPPRRGFSLVELMVVVAVISILLGLLMPGLARVRETTYRVMSASNQRSLGQGFTLWAGSHGGKLPPSRLLFDPSPDLGEMMRVYAPLTDDERDAGGDYGSAATTNRWKRSNGSRPQPPPIRHGWDGLGHLFASGLIPEPTTFYSPAHWGDHPFERYEHDWARPGEEEAGPPDHVVYGNYHYCGHLDYRGRPVLLERDANKIILTDGMRRQTDVTHRDGINILRANGSVEWKQDPTLMPKLPVATEGTPFSISRQNAIILEIFADPWNRLGYWEGAGGSP
jgi:prepilin-type N-terminal cleavage/methylation domain-containing protein